MITRIQPDSPAQTRTGRRCTATCADGTPCRAWAVHGTDPPRCAPHGGGRASACAPLGNQNARTHGFYVEHAAPDLSEALSPDECTIDVVIEDLFRKHMSLSRYIDDHLDDLPPATLARLCGLHAQTSSRLGKLLRDRLVLAKAREDDFLSDLIDETLEELSEEWGVDLTAP
jgi:hypothetical protein